jgi:hypothetical protein
MILPLLLKREKVGGKYLLFIHIFFTTTHLEVGGIEIFGLFQVTDPDSYVFNLHFLIGPGV